MSHAVSGSIPRLRRVLLACLCLGSLLAACDSSDPFPTTVVPTTPFVPATMPPETSLPPPVGTVPAPPMARLTDTWRREILSRTVEIPNPAADGSWLAPHSVIADGPALLATTQPPFSKDGGDRTDPEKLVLIDLATTQTTTLYTALDGRHTIYGVHGDRHWIVWTVGPIGGTGGIDWELDVYNRADGSRKWLANEGHNRDGTGAGGGDSAFDQGVVVWVEGRPDTPRTGGGAVKVADLATGRVTLLSTNGYMPRISWPYVAWMEITDPARPGLGTPFVPALAIRVLNIQTGIVTQLRKPYTPWQFALYQESLAWINRAGDRITLTNVAETVAQALPVGGGITSFERIALNDRLVRWDGGGGAQIWDRRQGRLITIANPGDDLAPLSGPYLLWQSARSSSLPAMIHILDTTRLP